MKGIEDKQLLRIKERLNSLYHMEYDAEVRKEIDKLLEERNRILPEKENLRIYTPYLRTTTPGS